MPTFDTILVDGGTARRGWEAGGGDRDPEKAAAVAISYLVGVLLRLRYEYTPGQIVVCWDSPGSHELRRKLYPGYKADRKPSGEGFRAVLEELREHLPALGVAQATGEDGEADDVLFTLATTWPGRIGVYSSDKDLLQLATCGPEITVIKPDMRRRKKDEHGEYSDPPPPLQLVTGESEVKVGGVTLPVHLVYSHLVLMGDLVDGIPGLAGCGEKTSARILAACPGFVAMIIDARCEDARDQLMKSDRGLVKWASKACELRQDIVASADLVRLYEVDVSIVPPGWDPGAVAAWAGRRQDTAWIAERVLGGASQDHKQDFDDLPF